MTDDALDGFDIRNECWGPDQVAALHARIISALEAGEGARVRTLLLMANEIVLTALPEYAGEAIVETTKLRATLKVLAEYEEFHERAMAAIDFVESAVINVESMLADENERAEVEADFDKTRRALNDEDEQAS